MRERLAGVKPNSEAILIMISPPKPFCEVRRPIFRKLLKIRRLQTSAPDPQSRKVWREMHPERQFWALSRPARCAASRAKVRRHWAREPSTNRAENVGAGRTGGERGR